MGQIDTLLFCFVFNVYFLFKQQRLQVITTYQQLGVVLPVHTEELGTQLLLHAYNSLSLFSTKQLPCRFHGTSSKVRVNTDNQMLAVTPVARVTGDCSQLLCFASRNTLTFNFYRSLHCARKKRVYYIFSDDLCKLIEI